MRCRLAGLMLCVLGSAVVSAAPIEKPNFIIINIDDLGYGDIGPYGSRTNSTPHLNRMAEEGRKLTCFYAAPVCSPSRASLMTGCYPKRALSIPHVLFPGNDVGLSPEEVTIAELLKQQGYATGIVGKWHLGDQLEFLPTRQGFDEYYGLPYSNDMGPAEEGVKSNLGAKLPMPRKNGQPPLPLLRNETVLQRVLAEDQQQLVANYTAEAIRFIKQHRKEPFFLYLPHSAVHFPLYPSEKWVGTSENGLHGDWVQEVDWSVGQVLNAVRELELSEKTLVVFTSDNGGALNHGSSNAPLKNGKGSTYEGGMRVPTIAWWPGQIPAGTSTDEVMGMFDLLPTCVALAGGETPTDRKLDGANVWPLLRGEAGARTPHDVYYYYRGQNLEAVRQGAWKLRIKGPEPELYNLLEDISERNNLAKQHPDKVAALREVASQMDGDLGTTGVGPGCRPLGKVEAAAPIIAHDGSVRSDMHSDINNSESADERR